MKKRIYRHFLALLFLIPLAMMAFKVRFLNYSLERTLSHTSYQIRLNYRFTEAADSAWLRIALPTSEERQTIRSEANQSSGYDLLIQRGKTGRYATWSGPAGANEALAYSFEFIGYANRYNLDSNLTVPDLVPESLNDFLRTYPVEALPEVEDNRLVPLLGSYFEAARDTQDAVLQFVNWVRHAGLPARFAGGFNLEQGEHEYRNWAEVMINNTWIPFDPAFGHFAQIPAGYMKINNSAFPEARHHGNRPFENWVEVKQRTTINPQLLAELPVLDYNAFAVWAAFEQAGIPIDILKVILLLPLGALVVVLFRNVIGISTFGIFLPALIAMASRETGLGYGIVAFLLVIGVVSLIYVPLERWGMLSVPKITIMLVSVVSIFILVSVLGVKAGLPNLAYIALFPIVVVTVSAERFAKTLTQDGFATAFKLTLQTLLVAAAAFTVMSSSTVESLFLTFPELFLIIIGLNLILGRWVGLRFTELFRFNWIVR